MDFNNCPKTQYFGNINMSGIMMNDDVKEITYQRYAKLLL